MRAFRVEVDFMISLARVKVLAAKPAGPNLE